MKLLSVCLFFAFHESFGFHLGSNSKFIVRRIFMSDKKPERKDISKILFKTIFPNIFESYDDVVTTKETIKVKTERPTIKNRFSIEELEKVDINSGRYNAVDPKSVPRNVDASQIKSQTLRPVTKPANFVAPEPKRAAGVRLGNAGKLMANIPPGALKQRKPVVMYDVESSTTCKKIRETLCMLDITVELRPCPNLQGWSDKQSARTYGNREVPYFLDDNPAMYKPELLVPDQIIEHLFRTYGAGLEAIPAGLKGLKAGNAKGNVNRSARADVTKLKPIELYGIEGAPYVTPVRECLQSLLLAHIFIPCAEGSKNRALLERKTGKPFQVPYISDPNTGVAMFESAEIVKYLTTTYTA